MKKTNLFCLAMMILLLTGPAWAGGGGQQQPQAAAGGPTVISVTATHWAPWPLPAEESVMFEALIRATNVKFEFDWRQRTDYDTQLATLLAGGKLPDLLGPGTFTSAVQLAREGAVIPLEGLLETHGQNILTSVGQDRMDSWVEVDGHIYTITGILDLDGSHSWMIRKDWLDKLGLNVPSTWDEWLTVWRAFRDNDMNGDGDKTNDIPMSLDTDGNGALTGLMHVFGIGHSPDGQYTVYEGKYMPVYEHPRYLDFLRAAQGLYQEGLLDREFASRTQDRLFTIMDSGYLGSTMTWAERASISTTVNRQGGNAAAFWRTVPPVKGPFGNQSIESRRPWVTSLCVTSGAQQAGKAEKIIEMFDWLYGEKGIEAYSYGIEGRTFDYVNGKPIVKPELLTDSFASYRAAGLQYSPFPGVWTTDAYLQCLTKGEPYERLPDQIKSFYDGLFTLNEGFYFPYLDTLTTDAHIRYSAELITNGVCVLRDRCVAGQITVEEFSRQYQALKGRGFQQIIDEGAAAYAAKTRQ